MCIASAVARRTRELAFTTRETWRLTWFITSTNCASGERVIDQVNVLVEEVATWNTINGFAFFVFPHVSVIDDNYDTVAAKFLQFGHDKTLAARVKRCHSFIYEQDTWTLVMQKDLSNSI